MAQFGYFSVPELAQILGISRIALYKKVKKGQIKAQKIGRNYAISKAYVEANIVRLKGELLPGDETVQIQAAVDKVCNDYQEVFNQLGKY